MVTEGTGSCLLMSVVVHSAEVARGTEAEARLTGAKVGVSEVAEAIDGLASSEAKISARCKVGVTMSKAKVGTASGSRTEAGTTNRNSGKVRPTSMAKAKVGTAAYSRAKAGSPNKAGVSN